MAIPLATGKSPSTFSELFRKVIAAKKLLDDRCAWLFTSQEKAGVSDKILSDGKAELNSFNPSFTIKDPVARSPFG
jgi:hypothetical protein